jgi:hypothetical protein
VNTFLNDCSQKWFYRMVVHLPESRTAAFGRDAAVHAALLENFRRKIETQKDMETGDVRAFFIGAFTEELDHISWTKDLWESVDELKNIGEEMVRVYMDHAAPTVEPAAVEEPMEGFIGDVPAHGYIDVRDVRGRIIDIGMAARKPARTKPAHRLQVATATMLSSQASGQATLSTLTSTKTVALHEETIDVTPADRKLTTRLYSIAQERMNADVHAPVRSSSLCSRKYCSFWKRCEAEFGGEVSD